MYPSTQFQGDSTHRSKIGHNSKLADSVRKSTVYAISFDLDTDTLQEVYPGPSWNNAYSEIRQILKKHGFTWKQGSVLFGDETVDNIVCWSAIQDLVEMLPWFADSVRDIRMLRIEENNDLMPVVERSDALIKRARKAERRD